MHKEIASRFVFSFVIFFFFTTLTLELWLVVSRGVIDTHLFLAEKFALRGKKCRLRGNKTLKTTRTVYFSVIVHNLIPAKPNLIAASPLIGDETKLYSLTGTWKANKTSGTPGREVEVVGGNQERQAGWRADTAACSYDLDPAVNTEGRRNLITGGPHPRLVDLIFLCARLRRRQRCDMSHLF